MNHFDNSRIRPSSRSTHRDGAVAVLMAFSLVMLLAFAVLLVDVAWMSSIQTEGQLATDIAARGALASYVGDRSTDSFDARVRKAQAVGETIFESTTVGRDSVDIDPEAIRFGFRTEEDGFVEGGRVANAVRLDLPNLKPGGFGLFLAPIFGNQTFNTSPSSTVASNPIDVVLCLDMSRSMAWSVGANMPPPGIPSIHIPPGPGSRWLALVDSVRVFLDKAEDQSPSLRIALVTFGGGVRERVDTVWDDTEARIETNLNFIGAARASIDSSLEFISANTLGWQTPTRQSLEISRDLFDQQSPSIGVRKVIILLSDGAATTGSPVTIATELADQGTTINTIYFSGDPQGVAPMQEIANLGGGVALEAVNTIELDQAFDQILSSLSVSIVE